MSTTPISKKRSATPEASTEASPSKKPKQEWEGWCEIESEHAYFSVMLREMGVQDVSVREVFVAEEDFLLSLPQPIYGLILLFRARLVDPGRQEAECPKNVWFANQMPVQNSCATLALLNTILNTTGVEIGEHLRQFKAFTADFTPYARGEALSSFDFIKRIHNSFATQMDRLENDKHLAAKVASKSKGKSKSVNSDASDESSESFENNAHHFIAFMPIDGEVWKLDGMDAQPTPMGEFEKDFYEAWLPVACQKINSIMAAGDHDYMLLALTQAPLAIARKSLCSNVATLRHVVSKLDALEPEWASFLHSEDGAAAVNLPSPAKLSSLGISDGDTAASIVEDYVRSKIDKEDLPQLLDRRASLVKEQAKLEEEVLEHMDIESDESRKAEERRWDYGPVVKRWVEMLAENGYLEENLGRFM